MAIDLMWNDLRFAWRNTVRRPAFTLLVVTTLALGIGVTSAVFALLDCVLLRALPYRDPSRLVFIWQTLPEHGVMEVEPTPFDYSAWRSLRSFAAVGLVSSDAYTIADGRDAERVRGARVSASMMPLLGISPAIGRAFEPLEDADSAAPTVVLGDGLWRRRFGADPQVLGTSVHVNGVAHTIVGVMPPSASLPGPLSENRDIWLPARMAPAERDNESSHNYSIVARLADGVTAAGAAAELDAFAKRMAAERRSHRGIGARLVSLDEQTSRGIRPTLLVVAGGVAMLLLVACANAATLLMARAASRRHEIAVRSALGATESRLLSLAVSESIVFATLGGIAGLTLGSLVLRGMLPLLAGSLPASATVTIGARAALFTALVAVALGLMFGLVVSLHDRSRVVDALKQSSRTTTSGRPIGRTRNILVVAQVALAVVLLSAAGLMLHSVVRLSRVYPGFDADRILSFRLSLTGSRYETPPQRVLFANDLLARLVARPGIAGAALTSIIPFGGTRGADGVEIEGRPKKPGEWIIIDQRHVTPSFFQTMGIRLLRGRPLNDTDDDRAERVVLVNRAMADRYWPGESPVDRRVRITDRFNSAVSFRIVGVVENVRHISLSRDAVPEMYHPYAQAPVPTFTVVVRATGNAADALPGARDVLRALDPMVPIYDARTMADRIAGSFAQTRATMLLLLATAVLAAALASVAIYGSIWYSVSQRIPEIGIRLALGATQRSVCGGIVGRALLLTSIGAGIGTAAGLAATPLLSGLLFDTPGTDPATHGAVLALLLALTIAASIVPARRAMRVDPIVALRSE